jgi:hypothetical protein
MLRSFISSAFALVLETNAFAAGGGMLLLGAGNNQSGVAGPLPTITATAVSVYPPNGTSGPINVGAGDTVVLVLCGFNAPSQLTASSPHLGSFINQGFLALGGQVLTANNTGGSLTGEVVTVSDSSARAWHLWSIHGANVFPIDGSPVFVAGTGSSQPLTVSVNTTNANRLILANALGASAYDSSPWTAIPAGQTAYGEFDESRPATTAGTYTAWAGQSANGQSLIVAIRP